MLRTARHLAPLGVVLAIWAAYYKTHGYGAAASGAYLDPGTDPLRYLAQAVHRVPSLAGALLASLPVEISVLSPALTWSIALLSIAVVVLVIRGLRLLLLDPQDARMWPWLVGGAFLALFPPAATWPSQRTLLAPSLVSAAIVAMLLLGLKDLLAVQPQLRLARIGRGMLVAIHLVISPLMMVAVSLVVTAQAPVMAKLARSPVLPRLADKHVVMLAAPDPVLSFYLPSLMASSGLAMPAQFNTLAISLNDVAVTRTGPDRIRLEALGAPLLSTQPEQLIMDPARMPHAGDVLAVPHLRAHVEKATAAGVTQVEFTFDAPLETLTFLKWHAGEVLEVPPPATTRTVIEHEIGVMGM